MKKVISLFMAVFMCIPFSIFASATDVSETEMAELLNFDVVDE